MISASRALRESTIFLVPERDVKTFAQPFKQMREQRRLSHVPAYRSAGYQPHQALLNVPRSFQMTAPRPIIVAGRIMAYSFLPAFDIHGNLPEGDYWPTEADFETRFVHVHGSASRSGIYDGFKRHRAALLAAGVDPDADCLLDGSYTTEKLDPGDVDLAVEVDHETFLHSTQVQALLPGPDTKAEFHCDAYPVLVLPDDHPHFERVTVAARAYWGKWFGRDRSANAKGCVWAKAQGFA